MIENFWVSGTTANVTLNGVQIAGGAQYSAGAVTVAGNTVVEKTGGAPFGMKIANNCLLKVDALGDNAKISVLANGVFSQEGDAATLKGYIDSGKICSDDTYAPVAVKDNALAVGVFRCVNGHTDHEGIECSEPIVAWKYWTEDNARAAITSWGGTYKDGEYKTRLDGTGNWILTEDVTLASARTTGTATLRIDLNGHDIIRSVTESNKATRVFYINNAAGSNVEITDLSTEGEAGTVRLDIAEGVTPTHPYGDIVYAEKGNFKLAGRAVLDASNLSTTSGNGTAVQLNSNREFVMYGGTIKGLTATGANAAAVGGWGGSTIAVFGGEILSGNNERAVCANGDFYMDHGKIQGGVQLATSATSVCNGFIGGDAVIEGGMNILTFDSMTVAGTPTVEGMNIPTGKTVDFTGVTGGSITVRAEGTFSTDFADTATAEAAMEFITPADSGEFMEVKGSALAMKPPVVRCINGHTSHEGINCTEPIVTWKYWTDANAKAAITSWGGTYVEGEYKTRLDGTGNWILTEDVTLAAARTTGTATLRIDLNGHDIIRSVTASNKATRVFYVNNAAGSNIEITDLSTEGEAGTVRLAVAEGVTTSHPYGDIVYAEKGNFKLAGRAVLDASNLNTTSGNGTAVQINSNRSFTMYGGVIKGLTGTGASSAAIGSWGNTTVTIHGGEILCSEGEKAVYVNGNFTMTGGEIKNGLVIGSGATATGVINISGSAVVEGSTEIRGFNTMTVSGTPTMQNVTVPSGKNIDFTGVTGGSITVKAEGYFSTDFASVEAATAAKAFITAAETGKSVTVNGTALTIGTPTTVTRCINGHRSHAADSTCTEPIVVWKYWTNENAKESIERWGTYVDGEYKTRMEGTGNWILTEDLTLSSQRGLGNGAALRIDLNGHDVIRKVTGSQNTRAFSATNSYGLCITDLSTEGEPGSVRVEVTSGATPVNHAGMVVYAESGPFTLAGRAVIDGSGISTTATSGMATVQVNGTHTFTMYGGTIKSLTATGDTSGALGGWSQTNIVIHGGTITSEGTSEQAVYTTGKFTMDGGKIVGGLQIGYAGATGVVTIGGTAEIDTFKLVGCTSCTLTGAARIGTLNNTSGKEPVKENFTGTVGG